MTLDVKGLRPDGYHDIETVMHQIDLYDTVTVARVERGLTVHTNMPDLPTGEANLAYRAAHLIIEKYEIQAGVAVKIQKHIPVGAGLAGGSANAAATLKGMARLFNLNLSWEDIQPLGASLGSDVPFCLAGGTALATGRGEILKLIQHKANLHFVLINPGFSVSTAEVYALLDQETITERPDSAAVIAGLKNHNAQTIAKNMSNVLELVTLKNYPILNKIKQQLMEAGALNALMSGSGPTIYGLFADVGHARQAYYQLRDLYPSTFICSSFEQSGVA